MRSLELAVLLITAVSIDCRNVHRSQQESPSFPQTFEQQQEPVASPGLEILESPKSKENDELVEEDLDDILVEGDIILTEEQWSALRQRKALKKDKYRWSEGGPNNNPQVPYVYMSKKLDICNLPYQIPYCKDSKNKKTCDKLLGCTNFKAFPDEWKPEVEKAIQHWRDHTCIEFVDITHLPETSKQRQDPHLLFDGREDTCSSYKGMLKKYPGQVIHAVCPRKTFGSRVHEIGHALGFYHEHKRSDRDQYIKIFPKYVDDIESDDDEDYGIEYDYSSVMHYDPLDGDELMFSPYDPANLELTGDRTGLSFRDKHLANKMYNCTEKWEKMCKINEAKPCNEGYIGKTCTCICPPHMKGEKCELDKPGYNGDYYHEKRSQKLNECVNSPMTLKAKVPDKTEIWGNKTYLRDLIFVKSIKPPKCKYASVTFTSKNLNSDCTEEFLSIVTDLQHLQGKKLCNEDLIKGYSVLSFEPIIINTIIRRGGPHGAIGSTLWEADIRFKETPYCLSSTSGQNPCSTIFTEISSWSNGLEGTLSITFPNTVDTWSLKLTFNKDITALHTGNAKSDITSSNTATLTAKQWNKSQQAGQSLNIDIIINFSEKPNLISVELDCAELCI